MTDTLDLIRKLVEQKAHETITDGDFAYEVARVIDLHDFPQETPAPVISDPFDAVMDSPLLNILAELTAHAGRIAVNTTRAPEHVAAEKVLERWPLRMHEEMAVPYVRSLGIEVDE